MAGGTSPATLAGTLLVQNAEVLAGITLAQLVQPGAPLIYGSFSGGMDMRTGGFVMGGSELRRSPATPLSTIAFKFGMCFRYGPRTNCGGAQSQPMITTRFAVDIRLRHPSRVADGERVL